VLLLRVAGSRISGLRIMFRGRVSDVDFGLAALHDLVGVIAGQSTGIGIGRSLATPPSHTTRHTGPYHGGSIWLHAVRCIQSDEAHLIKEAVVQCYPYPWGMADSPWTFATPRGSVRQEWVDPPLDQFRLPSPVHLPVFPLEASETMMYPAVHIPQHRGRLAEGK